MIAFLHRYLANRARTHLVAAAFGAAVLAHATFAAEPASPTVNITKFAYVPAEITVAPGTEIVWINHDEVPHTVTGDDKRLQSKAMDTDDRFEYTFTDEGDYNYHCAVHPFMIGVVHVRKP